MSKKDIRWIQRLENYSKALRQLLDGVELANSRKLSKLEEQGLIQAFEFTHELAWKTLQDFLNDKGNEEIYGSKDVVRASFKYGIIEKGEIWMDMIKNRNKTSHTYNEETAKDIISAILTTYHAEFKKLERKLDELKLKEK